MTVLLGSLQATPFLVAFPLRSDCKYADFTSVCQTTPCKAPYNTTMGGVMQINRRGIQSIHVPNHFSISTLYAISYKPCNPSTLHQANHHRAISQPNQKHQQHFETVIQGLERPENDFLQKNLEPNVPPSPAQLLPTSGHTHRP